MRPTPTSQSVILSYFTPSFKCGADKMKTGVLLVYWSGQSFPHLKETLQHLCSVQSPHVPAGYPDTGLTWIKDVTSQAYITSHEWCWCMHHLHQPHEGLSCPSVDPSHSPETAERDLQELD